MSTHNDEAPDKREETQEPRTRGGVADDDRSKGLGTEQSGGPFEAPAKDADEPKEKA